MLSVYLREPQCTVVKMEFVPQDRILKFLPDSLEAVRKDVNLDKNGRMKEGVDILENWIKMQPHFVKKDFSRDYLERTLISSKGYIERAKERLDKLCTFKTLMPEFFATYDVEKEFKPLQKIITTAHLPQLTTEHYRVYISKIALDGSVETSMLFNFYRYLVVLCEYFKKVDYSAGFVIILDYTDANLLNFVTKIGPMELRQIITLMTEGYGLRIKGIHVITSSSTVDILVKFLKQVFSAKLANRIHTHKTIEGVHAYVPKDILPAEYGGKEKSLREIQDQWFNVIESKEFLGYFKEMAEAKTNEALRQEDKFNQNYIGTPGSFRVLSLD